MIFATDPSFAHEMPRVRCLHGPAGRIAAQMRAASSRAAHLRHAIGRSYRAGSPTIGAVTSTALQHLMRAERESTSPFAADKLPRGGTLVVSARIRRAGGADYWVTPPPGCAPGRRCNGRLQPVSRLPFSGRTQKN